MPKLAAVQMTSTNNVQANLQQAASLIKEAAEAGAELIVLPEMFAKIGANPQETISIQEKYGSGPLQTFLSEQAKEHKIILVGGTIPLRCSNTAKATSSSLVFNAEGKCIARYDKLHLFDVKVSPTEIYQESETILPGDHITVVDTPLGRLGVVVCYDIRFPELFKILLNQNVEIIAVPAAFTIPTGQAHWEILLRARSIDAFAYIVGADQVGQHNDHRATYGHSIIVAPGGAVMTCLTYGTGFITAEMNHDFMRDIRMRIPIQSHSRIKCELI